MRRTLCPFPPPPRSSCLVVAAAACSWSTCSPLLEQHAAAVTFECDADDAPPGQQTLSFGAPGAPVAPCSAAASSGAGRHSYFRARKLQRAGLGL